MSPQDMSLPLRLILCWNQVAFSGSSCIGIKLRFQAHFRIGKCYPGYDYSATCGVPVYAAVDGTVTYPHNVPPNSSGNRFHALQLTPDPPNDQYAVYYLHLED